MPGDDRIQLADSDRFLAPSKPCDADHPAIREAALSLGRSRDSEREKAIRVFHFVRDQVLFQFSRFSDPAADPEVAGGRGPAQRSLCPLSVEQFTSTDMIVKRSNRKHVDTDSTNTQLHKRWTLSPVP